MAEPKLTFAMRLEGKLAKEFLAIKEEIGLVNNAEVIRHLIHDKYVVLFSLEAQNHAN